MAGPWRDLGGKRLPRVAAALACALLPGAAVPGTFSTVEPARVLAGSWYDGATLRVTGSIDEHAQVAIRVTGPLEHHAFNRRGKIGGVIWGGVEHVTFENAPGLYELFTSAALGAVAPPAVRERLRLGYDTLAAHMEVRRGAGDAAGDDLKARLIEQLVRLKESEGLYRVAPGAVHLGDPASGRRTFEVEVPLPATTAPGDIEVAVLELAGGAVVHEDAARVQLQRVGMPAFLFELAHERSTAFGLLAVFALMVTGIGVDLLGSRGHKRPHPAVMLLTGIARGVDEAVLPSRQRPRSPEQVERMLSKYRLFRTLLALNNEVLEHLSDLEEESSWTSFHHSRVRMGIRALFDGTADMVGVLNELTGQRYFDLANVVATLRADVFKFMEKASERRSSRLVVPMAEIGTDTADQVGDKAVSLARIECDLRVHVPEYFSVTIEAYREFLEHAGLASQLRTLLAPARLDAPDDFRRRCDLARELVRAAEVPAAVAEAIRDARRTCGFPEDEGLAVRSSAAGEGSELSFAGQFETFLNVPASGLVEAWRDVVASRFSPRAVFYRRAAGLADVDTPMSVLVQRMVRARASGVLFTRPPDDPRGAELFVTSGPGLGPDVSAGIASADQFVVSRGAPHRILERRIAPKRARLVEARGGGLTRLALDTSEQLQASIGDAEAIQLAEVGLAIERYFGKPQDIEWVIDGEGTLFVLQSRPLRTEKPEHAGAEVPSDARLLLRGGEPVWQGRAVGRVHVARTPREEEETPAGALLVVPQLLPDCVRLLPRVCGIVAERGTITGHAASILREFRIPSLFGVKGALDALAPGQLVSVDVGGRGIFDGALWPELRGRTVAVGGGRTLGLPDLLAGKLTKLSGTAFIGTWACQSLHDVIRFAHEMAIQSMFDIGDRLLESPIGGVKRVDSAEPLFVHVLDLGGGLRPEAASKRSVSPADIASAPFQGLWRGLADPNFHPRRPERLEPSASVLAATRAMSGPSELGVPNYACISDSYLNLNARGGVERDPLRVRPRRQAYHYVVVDSFLSESPNENHIRMRFRGGGAAPWQRRLRAEVAAEILRLHHFTATVTGELMNAWMRGIDRATGQEQLATIGRLLRFLARLDMWMTEEADVKLRVEAFADAEAEALAPRTGPGKATG
jgi:pyruvate,water dikinase